MYTEYTGEMTEDDLYGAPAERTSDIQLPPAINVLLLGVWGFICLIGFAVIFLGQRPFAGAAIIAVPTFIGMVIKPTFALCMLMLVLPTGAGIGYREEFSLDRGIGLALAVSFVLNLLIMRPRLRIGNKGLWVIGAYTTWVFLSSLASPYLGLELRRAFTQVQLLALALIVYWIVETNGEGSLRWALRSYVIGTLGMVGLAFATGKAMRAVEESTQERYTATLGGAINANMLAALTGMAFLATVYLLARDRRLLWRLLHFGAVLVLPIMLLRIGSRGNLVALMITVLLPLIFVRQVSRRPALAVLLLVIVLVASVSAAVVVRSRGLETGVTYRLTDVGYAKEAIGFRLDLIKRAVGATIDRPLGNGYYTWFEKTGLYLYPHSDFFFIMGVYGVPGAALFVLFVIFMLGTIRRTGMGWEKLYSRAVLTYLLVVGMNNTYVYKKFYWVFMALVMAVERISSLYLEQSEAFAVDESEGLLNAYPAY